MKSLAWMFLIPVAALSLNCASCSSCREKKEAVEGAAEGVAAPQGAEVVKKAAVKSYSAKVIMSSKSGQNQGKFYAMNDRTRLELPQSTIITRLDKGLIWIVMPAKTYIERSIRPQDAAIFIDSMPAGMERKFLENGRIDDREVRKFEITYDTEQGKKTLYQWVDEKTDIPLRIAAKDGVWSFEYQDVKPGEQNPALFELPPDYTEMTPMQR